MTQAKDVMTSEVISLHVDTQVYEAVRTLSEHNITGVPVIDENNYLVGILSEKDVIRLYSCPEHGEHRTIREFMTQPAVFFEETEDLAEVFQCLSESDFRRVPIVCEGKLTGIISRKDLLDYLLAKRVEHFMQSEQTSETQG